MALADLISFLQNVFLLIINFFKKNDCLNSKKTIIPHSVNYHITRKCNYSCGFCFHTAKTSYVEGLEASKRGLKLLKEAGMKKINFAGGEPFLEAKKLGELVKYCSEELKLESVSIVSNGSKIKESWIKEYSQYISILAISCDSFNEEVNEKIGRGKGNHIQNVKKCRDLCEKYNIKFKINTVVNKYNFKEDMNKHIKDLNPCRWKVFQVLLLEGENSGKNQDKRDVTQFLITDDEFEEFLQRHKEQKCLVAESNNKMKNSYLILDEYMRFLNCTKNGKEPTESILKVGVKQALEQSGFDENMFFQRGGAYDWKKSDSCTSTCSSKEYDW